MCAIVQNESMRRLLFALTLLTLSAGVHAEDVLGPAEYLKILAGSRLKYRILSEPSKTPVELQTCARRDESMRVVQKGAEKSLAPWPLKLEVAQKLSEGEKLFQAKKYDEAAALYKAAIEADPELAAAYLFYGDALLFGKKDPAAALAQYQKAIALDATLPMPHMFASTAYAQLGRKANAREEIIKALTFYPAYPAVWKIAAQNPGTWGAKPVVRHPFNPPRGYLGTAGKEGIDVYAGADNEWLSYALCKAVWANEERFKKHHGKGGWSVVEEQACVLNHLMAAFSKAGENPDALAPLERHLFDVVRAELLDGYILFEIIGQHCPIMLSVMSDGARQQVEAYIRKFVIVAAD